MFAGMQLKSGKPQEPDAKGDGTGFLTVRHACLTEGDRATLNVHIKDSKMAVAILTKENPFTSLDLRFYIEADQPAFSSQGGDIDLVASIEKMDDIMSEDEEEQCGLEAKVGGGCCAKPNCGKSTECPVSGKKATESVDEEEEEESDEEEVGEDEEEEEESDEEEEDEAAAAVKAAQEEAEKKAEEAKKKREEFKKQQELNKKKKAEQEKAAALKKQKDAEIAKQKEEAAKKKAELEKNADFIASKKFTGAKKGMVFKKGKKGMGYYKDTPPTPVVGQKRKGNDQGPPKKRQMTLAGGLKVEIVKTGRENSHPVKKGQKALVRYDGRLAKNGKRFDKGSIPFRVGAGEVIRGWDLGVEGMQLNEKRKLLIPPGLAYGKRGAPPDIPGNAHLTFDVELLKIN